MILSAFVWRIMMVFIGPYWCVVGMIGSRELQVFVKMFAVEL